MSDLRTPSCMQNLVCSFQKHHFNAEMLQIIKATTIIANITSLIVSIVSIVHSFLLFNFNNRGTFSPASKLMILNIILFVYHLPSHPILCILLSHLILSVWSRVDLHVLFFLTLQSYGCLRMWSTNCRGKCLKKSELLTAVKLCNRKRAVFTQNPILSVRLRSRLFLPFEHVVCRDYAAQFV